jgi:response regulator of citrate/malate metabolism
MRNNTPDIILIALLSNYTIRNAAKETGISESTIKKYLSRPDFMRRYNEARADILRGVCGALQDQMNDAVKVMAELMNDPESPPLVRLNAAKAILE